MAQPLGVALLGKYFSALPRGSGIFVREEYLPALAGQSAQRLLRLKAIYSRTHKSAKVALEKFSRPSGDEPPTLYHDESVDSHRLEDLLARKDISAVIVALPIMAQPEIILKCLAAGKHVLSEKPIAPSVDQAVDMVQMYERHFQNEGLIWRVAENFESGTIFGRAREYLQDPELSLGHIISLAFVANFHVAAEGNKWLETSWRANPEHQGGMVLDGGVHYPAAIRSATGLVIESVVGVATQKRAHLPPVDTLHALVTFTNGVTGTFEASWSLPSTVTGCHMRIACEEGDLLLDLNFTSPHIVATSENGYKISESIPHDGVTTEIEAFAEACLGKAGLGWGSPRLCLEDLRVIEACLKSSGHRIVLRTK